MCICNYYYCPYSTGISHLLNTVQLYCRKRLNCFRPVIANLLVRHFLLELGTTRTQTPHSLQSPFFQSSTGVCALRRNRAFLVLERTTPLAIGDFLLQLPQTSFCENATDHYICNLITESWSSRFEVALLRVHLKFAC
jgi:hypothetical protein